MRFSYPWVKFNKYSKSEISYIFNYLKDQYTLCECVSREFNDNGIIKKEKYYVISEITDRPELFNFKIEDNIIKYYSRNDSFKKEFASIIEAILIEYSNNYWN